MVLRERALLLYTMLRKTLSLTSLPAVVAALLLVSLLPLALCDQAASCPMQEAREGAGADVSCVPGPTFDCCDGDEAPSPRSPDRELLAKHLPSAASIVTSMPVIPPRPHVAGTSHRSALGVSAADVPLFTLHAALLI